MKKIMLYPSALVLSGILIFTLVSCGSDSDDDTALTLNQAHREILSVLVIADTLSNVMPVLSGLPSADLTIPCGGSGSTTIEKTGATSDIMTWNNCQNDAAQPDTINGVILRDQLDADSSGVAEDMIITVTSDFTLEVDYDDDGNLDSTIVWSEGVTLDHQGFNDTDIIDGNGDPKVNVIVNGCADATIFGNKTRMTHTDFDLFSNQQDPGAGFDTEFSLNGTVQYRGDCVTTTMEMLTTPNFQMSSKSVGEGTISINNGESVLNVMAVDSWRLAVDGASQDYTQAEFQQLPATCP
jgi:hypothetical protein